MSGRKVFTAGEVLQAADVNDFLMDQSVMVFAGTAARGSAIPSPTEGMVTYRSDDDAVEVYDGSTWNAVGPGKILQVVSTAKTDTFSTTSTSFTDITGMSATITPSSTSSKILILAQISFGGVNGAYPGDFKFQRGGTDIYIGDAASSRTRAVFGGIINSNMSNFLYSMPINFLDSPSTTSATTYQLQTRVTGGTHYLNRSTTDTDGSAWVRGASSVTLMEVAG